MGNPESETVAGGLLEKIHEDPPLEKQNPKGLSAAAVFQQKLFGSGLDRFMSSTTDSAVVIPIPIPSYTTTGNEEPLETKFVDMEVSISNPPPHRQPVCSLSPFVDFCFFCMFKILFVIHFLIYCATNV